MPRKKSRRKSNKKTKSRKKVQRITKCTLRKSRRGSKNKYNISKKEAERLYMTIKTLHDIFIKNNISYWVTGGTLIGAIRHRGVIPWDDDGDVCIMKKDVPKLRKLIKTFKRKGYILKEGEEDDDASDDEELLCWEKPDSCTWYLEYDGKHSLGVDIFIMEKVGPIITYADPYWRTAGNGGKRCYFLEQFTFPLIPTLFGNFWVMTPFNSVEHLNQCYGVSWNSKSQRLFDHRSGRWVDSKLKRMLADDYETIYPPKQTCAKTIPQIQMVNPRSKKVSELTTYEVRLLAKLYQIKGKTVDKLRAKISKLL